MNADATNRVTPVTWKAGEAEKTTLKLGWDYGHHSEDAQAEQKMENMLMEMVSVSSSFHWHSPYGCDNLIFL